MEVVTLTAVIRDAARRLKGKKSARPEQVQDRPSRDETLDAICRDTGVNRQSAEIWLNWLQSTIGVMRSQGETTHYLSTGELERHHRILDAIAPDDTVARPGSAHDVVERHVLDPARGELSLTHSKADRWDAVYCSVTVDVMRVDVG